MSVADLLNIACEDGSCCCIPSRKSVSFISIINLCACTTDMLTAVCPRRCCGLCNQLNQLRVIMDSAFQIANIMLLIATVIEKPILINFYLWSAFAYVLIGFVLTLIDFVISFKHDGLMGLATYIPDVIFLFVVFRCLPLIDGYRKILLSMSAPQSLKAPPPIAPIPNLENM